MIEIRRIGFLADTHSRKADGSDLPQQALDAFAGVDLIVHLGDIGQKGILERLGEVAPVLILAGAIPVISRLAVEGRSKVHSRRTG